MNYLHPMPLNLYTSNRMEVLVDTIATTLQKPLGSAFTKEVIVVQRWLSMELELSSHRSIVTMV